MKKVFIAVCLVFVLAGAGISASSFHADQPITTKDKVGGLK